MPDKELGIKELAKHMKKSPSIVRSLLRTNKVKKAGKAYTWGSKKELESVAKKLGGSSSPKKAAVKTKRKPAQAEAAA